MIIPIIFSILALLMLLNLYYRRKTVKSLENDFSKLNWQNLPTNQYVMNCYNYVSNRFPKVNQCWIKYPWKNMFLYDIWQHKGKGVPCHMQNYVFQRLLKKKLPTNNFKTVFINAPSKGMLIHFYSKVKLNRRWVDVDVWGKKWGIPFGKHINNWKLVE